MTGAERPVRAIEAWVRRLALATAAACGITLATQPLWWGYVLGLVVFGTVALVMPGPVFFRALAGEKEREALSPAAEEEDAT